MLGHEKRGARRVPVSSKVKIVSALHGETHYGTTRDISVSSVALETDYVPHHGEELELTILPGDAMVKPLRALARVTACTEVEPGRRYAVVVAIVKVID
jgi:hypothetical protein